MTGSANSSEDLAKLAALDAAVARGFDDAESGRVKPSLEVFDRLEEKLAGTAGRPPSPKSPED